MGVNLFTITTERLRLEPLTLSHADRLFKLHQDKTLYTWMAADPPQSLEANREKIQFLEKRLSQDGSEYWFQWVAVEKGSGEFVGRIEATLKPKLLDVYLAYFTYQSFQKKGFAKEGCLAIIDYMAREWKAQRLVIEMDTRNEASIRLTESLGAKRMGYKERVEHFKGCWSNEYLYELLLLLPPDTTK